MITFDSKNVVLLVPMASLPIVHERQKTRYVLELTVSNSTTIKIPFLAVIS